MCLIVTNKMVKSAEELEIEMMSTVISSDFILLFLSVWWTVCSFLLLIKIKKNKNKDKENVLSALVKYMQMIKSLPPTDTLGTLLWKPVASLGNTD